MHSNRKYFNFLIVTNLNKNDFTQNRKNKINKEGLCSMNATPTRPSNTGPPTRSPARQQTET
jgi:hypothetical protein